jgi:erythronate-4-phosphate dehydrogenase
MKIVVDKAIPYICGVLEPYVEVKYLGGADIGPADVVDADALVIRTRTRCDRSLLEGSRVKLIATATIGCDHIDMDFCNTAGIEVCSAPGCNARGVLQWVAAALRHIVDGDGGACGDYTLGVVGVGNVGSLVSRYARHWGFNVMECDPPRKAREGGDFRELEELARHCDIITFHTPLDASTYHLVDDTLIDMMHDNAVIINASRGGVVDNMAVMRSGHRYYFDVWEGEPNVEQSLASGAAFATPHIAGYSEQGKANATAAVVGAVARYFGLPLNGWYPSGVESVEARLISWNEMCDTIDNYFDAHSESEHFKRHLADFEQLRNGYRYRKEYF